MKKITKYVAEDKTEFSTRKDVISYETNLKRRELVTKFLLRGLEVQDAANPVTLSKVIEVICANPENFAMNLSARYARTVAKLPGPKRTFKRKQKPGPAPRFVPPSTGRTTEQKRSA
jgi:hypothetical protein